MRCDKSLWVIAIIWQKQNRSVISDIVFCLEIKIKDIRTKGVFFWLTNIKASISPPMQFSEIKVTKLYKKSVFGRGVSFHHSIDHSHQCTNVYYYTCRRCFIIKRFIRVTYTPPSEATPSKKKEHTHKWTKENVKHILISNTDSCPIHSFYSTFTQWDEFSKN